MLFYQTAFGICLLLLCGSYAALLSAHKRGDKRQARVLHIFRLGLCFSAISYLLRITDSPRDGQPSFLIFVTCLAGTAFIWLGWMEHWRMRMERMNAPAAPIPDDGLPCLNVRAQQVFLYAQDEARRRRQCSVDTEHLLLGLLREPHSAGVRILRLLGVNLEKVHLELAFQAGSDQTPLKEGWKPVLTEGAHSVVALAAQEAHRFEEAGIGTEHLLLGLMLAGKGKAACVLFQEGVTVDGIRNEIIKAKKSA